MDINSLVFNMLTEDMSDISSDCSSTSLSSCDSFIGELCNDYKEKNKNEKYMDVVSEYTDEEFMNEFGLNRATVAFLTDELTYANILPTHGFGREKILPMKAILITLRYLTHLETFRQISHRFQISPSSVYRILHRIVLFFVKLLPKYVRLNDVSRTALAFEKTYGIKNIVGVLDVCHIKVRRPMVDDDLYRAVTGSYTILLQAVVDSDRRFVDVYCGEPGSSPHIEVLLRSPLNQLMQRGEGPFSDGRCLLTSYVHQPYSALITPLSPDFTAQHETICSIAPDTFSMLKKRFRRLVSFENSDMEFIVQCTSACCALHNISLEYNSFTKAN